MRQRAARHYHEIIDVVTRCHIRLCTARNQTQPSRIRLHFWNRIASNKLMEVFFFFISIWIRTHTVGLQILLPSGEDLMR